MLGRNWSRDDRLGSKDSHGGPRGSGSLGSLSKCLHHWLISHGNRVHKSGVFPTVFHKPAVQVDTRRACINIHQTQHWRGGLFFWTTWRHKVWTIYVTTDLLEVITLLIAYIWPQGPCCIVYATLLYSGYPLKSQKKQKPPRDGFTSFLCHIFYHTFTFYGRLQEGLLRSVVGR